MNEEKKSQRTGFGVGANKDFFDGEQPIAPITTPPPATPTATSASMPVAIPKKPQKLEKPVETPPPQNTKQPPTSGVLPRSILPQKPPQPSPSEPSAQPASLFENVSSLGLPKLRTYRQDVAGVMRDKKTSLVQMVLEEQKERMSREREKSPTSGKNLPLILLSVIFLFSAVGIVYYIYFRLNPVDHTLEDLKVTPLIFVEKNKEASTEGKDSLGLKKEIASELRDADLKVDAIEYVFLTETLSVQTPNGVTQKKNLIVTDRFFETMGIKMPPMLLRSLRPDFMLGVHSFNKNQPFLVLKTDYYDNAFAGMLDWESTLVEDIFPIFGKGDRVAELSQRKWGDAVIKNKDTRVLRNFDGSIALVYAFKDQHTLVIATSEDTLIEVSRRLDLAKEKRPE